MKKILDFIVNPIKMIALGGVFLAFAFIDSFLVGGASSMADLSIFGKASSIGFCIVLGALFVRFFIIPVGKWLINLVS